MIPVERLKADIKKYMTDFRHDAMTFNDLMEVDGFKGKYTFGNHLRKQIFWSGVSAPGIAALKSLMTNNEIVVMPCGPEIYKHQGQWLSLPIGSKPEATYTKDVWIPVALAVVRETTS